MSTMRNYIFELNAISDRAESASPGPWEVYAGLAYDKKTHTRGVSQVGDTDEAIFEDRYVPPNDAEFIAAARTDIPRLVAALRAVLAESRDDFYRCEPVTTTDIAINAAVDMLSDEIEQVISKALCGTEVQVAMIKAPRLQ